MVRRPTTYHWCDARQGQKARDTRYDGKENKGNLIDLKSNLYTYVRQTPGSKTHETDIRETRVSETRVCNSRETIICNSR